MADAPAHLYLSIDRWLPNELSICVLRRLRGVDLVAACQASATWAALIHAESVWRQACVFRWPHAFSADYPSPDSNADHAPPLATPQWVHSPPAHTQQLTTHKPLRQHPHLSVPPARDADEDAWRRYYLENDLYEALNLAPAFAQEGAELQHKLRAATWCWPFISSVAVEFRAAAHELRVACEQNDECFSNLRHLTIALPPAPSPPSHALTVQCLEQVGGRMSRLCSLWVTEPALGEGDHLEQLLQLLETRTHSLQVRATGFSNAPPSCSVHARAHRLSPLLLSAAQEVHMLDGCRLGPTSSSPYLAGHVGRAAWTLLIHIHYSPRS